jgi:hypothetical protein
MPRLGQCSEWDHWLQVWPVRSWQAQLELRCCFGLWLYAKLGEKYVTFARSRSPVLLADSQDNLLSFDDSFSIQPYSPQDHEVQLKDSSQYKDPYEDSAAQSGLSYDNSAAGTVYDLHLTTYTSRSTRLYRPVSAGDTPTNFGKPTAETSSGKHRSATANRGIGSPIPPSSEYTRVEDEGHDICMGERRPASVQRQVSSGRDDRDYDGMPRERNVYVVHADGGDGNVHIQLPEAGARVIELPPNYEGGADRSTPQREMRPGAQRTPSLTIMGPRGPRRSKSGTERDQADKAETESRSDQRQPLPPVPGTSSGTSYPDKR